MDTQPEITESETLPDFGLPGTIVCMRRIPYSVEVKRGVTDTDKLVTLFNFTVYLPDPNKIVTFINVGMPDEGSS